MDILVRALIVGAGGFVGSAARFMASTWVQRVAPTTTLPLGTLAVNVLGCLAIGAIAGLADHRWELSSSVWLFLVVGVLGGFTTFSAFGHEVFVLGSAGARLHALLHVAMHLTLGLGAAWLGYEAATKLS
ncbi:MAG: fluoride efflux transporter CrcB [Acidobacteria bacterium]|nr:fluoride efflux transporter CrcB [Acidobacteriota bacterium]